MSTKTDNAELRHEATALREALAKARDEAKAAREAWALAASERDDAREALRQEHQALLAKTNEAAHLANLLHAGATLTREAREEMLALAEHHALGLRPPEWLPRSVAERPLEEFTKTWLARSTMHSARVAGAVLEAAYR